MEDYLGGFLLAGLIIGLIIGVFITLIFKEDTSNIRDKLIETQNILNETITERDTYKNLILEKSLEN